MLADDHGIRNASCDNCTPCVFPAKFDTS